MTRSRFIFLALILPLMLVCACNKDSGTPEPSPTPEPEVSGNTTIIYEANLKLFSKTNAILNLQNQLTRLKKMNVSVIWLMPIYEEGVEKAAGSPYCVKDYKKVYSPFGTLDDLKSFVNAAHESGIRVILDYVANHTSWDHAWITAHPDWYTQEGGKIISPKGMGWDDVADLNYSSTAMRAEMKESILYWVKEADVDGFRCDYADGVPKDFWTDVISSLKTLKGDDLLMLAESSDTDLYEAGFDMLYAWSWCGNLPSMFSGLINWTSLKSIYDEEMSSTPSGKFRMRYSINHDTASENSPITLYKGEKGALAAFVLATFLEGMPMIYSSQEIGYDKALDIFSFNILNWNSNTEYQQEYQKITDAYYSSAQLRPGSPTIYNTGDIASIRYVNSTDKGLLVFVNTKGSSQSYKTPMEVAGKKVKDLITGTTSNLSSSISLDAYEYLIYQIL